MLARVRRQTRADYDERKWQDNYEEEDEEEEKPWRFVDTDDEDIRDEYADQGFQEGEEVEEEEEEEDEILLSPRKRGNRIREDWEDDPME